MLFINNKKAPVNWQKYSDTNLATLYVHKNHLICSVDLSV